VPENIPHSSQQLNGAMNPINQVHPGHSGSPVKESSYLQRETSAEDMEEDKENPNGSEKAEPVKAPNVEA
jgi:hypothetical protein